MEAGNNSFTLFSYTYKLLLLLLLLLIVTFSFPILLYNMKAYGVADA